jgi:hypothetical protein
MTHQIQPGQEYESCDPRDYIRIRVLSTSGFGRITIATLTADGRELRQRLVNARQFHAEGTNRNGEQRRTGYRLVQHADGIPAGKAAGR